MKNGVGARLLIAVMLLSSFMLLPDDEGRDSIRRSFAQKDDPIVVDISDLTSLPNPVGVRLRDKKYESKLIKPFKNPRNLKEGDLVTVFGYLHVISLLSGSNDIQVQITSSDISGDDCLILKLPTADGVADADAKKYIVSARKFITEKIMHGQKLTEDKGYTIGGKVYLKATGQLFYDNSRATVAGKGKQGMEAKNLWELHPVKELAFSTKAR